jgi:hypothetical protein
MIYQKYEGFTKTYVICRGEGFGVMEAPYIQKEVVFETDDYNEALSEQERLTKANNTAKEIKSTWIPNTYWINVNTLSKKGEELFNGTQGDFETKPIDLDNFDITNVGEYTFYHKKHPKY